MATYTDTCHRGAVRFDVEADLDAGLVRPNISPKTGSWLAVAHP